MPAVGLPIFNPVKSEDPGDEWLIIELNLFPQCHLWRVFTKRAPWTGTSWPWMQDQAPAAEVHQRHWQIVGKAQGFFFRGNCMLCVCWRVHINPDKRKWDVFFKEMSLLWLIANEGKSGIIREWKLHHPHILTGRLWFIFEQNKCLCIQTCKVNLILSVVLFVMFLSVMFHLCLHPFSHGPNCCMVFVKVRDAQFHDPHPHQCWFSLIVNFPHFKAHPDHSPHSTVPPFQSPHCGGPQSLWTGPFPNLLPKLCNAWLD